MGLTGAGTVVFALPLAGRGHAAAAHPTRAEAVAFARRPGRFAVILACHNGAVVAELTAPDGRHFYGHGTYSKDGLLLLTTENDYESGRGVIGIWDVASGYHRVGEIPSNGVGPHDIKLMPDGQSLVVANGGIETHPDMGRAKLNLTSMAPNLSYVQLDGHVQEVVTLPAALHKLSIRHLALRPDGLVAFAMQWQGQDSQHPPLLGLHTRGHALALLSAPDTQHRDMQGYAGSVAMSVDGTLVAITSPRGGAVQIFDVDTGQLVSDHHAPDVCGIGALDTGFVYTTGAGRVGAVHGPQLEVPGYQWDNHLVPVSVSL